MSDGDICIICRDDIEDADETRIACETCSAVFHARCLMQSTILRSLATPYVAWAMTRAATSSRYCIIPVPCVLPGHQIGPFSTHCVELTPSDRDPLWRVMARRIPGHMPHIYMALVLICVWYMSNSGLAANGTDLVVFAILSVPIMLFMSRDREIDSILICFIGNAILGLAGFLFICSISQVDLYLYASRICQTTPWTDAYSGFCPRLAFLPLALIRIAFVLCMAEGANSVLLKFRSTSSLTFPLLAAIISSIIIASSLDIILGESVIIYYVLSVYNIVFTVVMTVYIVGMFSVIIRESDNITVCRYLKNNTCVSREHRMHINIERQTAVMAN